MQATTAQKGEVLKALFGYVQGQITGAQSALDDAEAYEDSELEMARGHGADALDILQVTQMFAEHGDMNMMLHGVNAHDTMVREDVYELLCNCGAWDVLKTLEHCFYKT